MPLYEYECETCAHRFERIQKFSDPPPAACPKCGAPVRKLLSSPAIQFKGSGFYLTDYGRGTTSKAEGAGGKSGKPEGGAKGGSEASAGKSDGASGESGKSGKSDSAKGDGNSSTAAKATTESSSAKATPAKSD